MLSARRNSVSSSRVVGKDDELDRPNEVKRDHQNGDRHENIGDDEQIEQEGGQWRDKRHDDRQNRKRHGKLAEDLNGRRGSRRQPLFEASGFGTRQLWLGSAVKRLILTPISFRS